MVQAVKLQVYTLKGIQKLGHGSNLDTHLGSNLIVNTRKHRFSGLLNLYNIQEPHK